MTRNINLILLPGLDGTDVFFRPLIASLPPPVSPRVVCLPTSGAWARRVPACERR